MITIFLVIHLTLSSLSEIFGYIGAYEFIFSQTPHSMKGLLIGTLFATRGIHQTLALGFTLLYHHLAHKYSCGVYYYLASTLFGFLSVLVFVLVARKYRRRERDEVCNVHQYAEQYYSNVQP